MMMDHWSNPQLSISWFKGLACCISGQCTADRLFRIVPNVPNAHWLFMHAHFTTKCTGQATHIPMWMSIWLCTLPCCYIGFMQIFHISAVQRLNALKASCSCCLTWLDSSSNSYEYRSIAECLPLFAKKIGNILIFYCLNLPAICLWTPVCTYPY